MTLCKLCKANACDTKSHVIPRWIYKSFLGKTEQFIIPNSSTSKPRITQAGIFDYQLVCNMCEKLFLDADTYSAKFFRDKPWNPEQFEELIPSNTREAKERYFTRTIDDADYQLLRLFVLNTLWRISESNDPFFKQVNLGKRTNNLSELVLEQSVGKPDDFPFMIFKLLDNPDAIIESQNFMMQPRIARGTDGYWYFKLSLPGFEIHVCTDSRDSHGLPEPLLVKPGSFTTVGIPAKQSASLASSIDVMRAHLRGRSKHMLTKKRSTT